ncbi:MBL fold metallo-hydrolase [Nakamurella flavida]|uniref:MBL fold metallo-hydrolase n=1 Tax=Nakamurella flavida TaxID=363630 RepID=A0A939C392_9ACTN|nr:MBL fold metallo-hydrolase [Nakamurella flavida]MBM9477390.1 MBL fold metallo-hydrolase [Nakamurella flavida]MDP9777322.1 glyoxylase-like metal-dependent hydrolase (beta-lactamase superfamily II) [Nakamurella flavida]
MFIAGFPAGSFQANCYVLAAEPGGDALVVDPGQDALVRLEPLLAEHGLRPVAVLLTHGHLDHIASAAALCRSAGIPAHLHAADEVLLDDPLSGLLPELRAALAGMPLDGLRPEVVHPLGGELVAGGLRIAVHHTPGHTRGSVVFRLAAADDRPEVLLTGDTLFAGSVGRTDLPGGSTAELTASLHDHLLTRPDDAVVLPGHGPTSTIGAERVGNPYLQRV